MTIKKKLLINMLLPIGTLLLIILAMISYDQRRDEIEHTNDMVLSLLTDMSGLCQSTDSYLLLGDSSAKNEWYQFNRSVSVLLDQLHFQDKDKNYILKRIRGNLEQMRNLF